jgi:hypothetical protein
VIDKLSKDPTTPTEPIKQMIITSKGQTVMTKEQTRVGLNADDNKRIRKGDKFYAIGYSGDDV